MRSLTRLSALRWVCGVLARVCVALAMICAALASQGCSSAFVRGAAGYDAGTLGVSGVETGFGGQIEAVGYTAKRSASYGLGAALEIAGFSTGGDADPIAFTTLEGRYRRPFEPPQESGAYWELGSGAGLAWAPDIQRAVLPLQGELGLQTRMGSAMLSVGLRERFLVLVGSGSPAWDAFNSVQLVAGLGFGAGRGR
jgi:hypothetical protein